MEWPKKNQVGISSCSLLSGPSSSKNTGTLCNLGGYTGFRFDFSLHFLLCTKTVMTVFTSYFEGILAIYCCTFNIHEISALDLHCFFANNGQCCHISLFFYHFEILKNLDTKYIMHIRKHVEQQRLSMGIQLR